MARLLPSSSPCGVLETHPCGMLQIRPCGALQSQRWASICVSPLVHSSSRGMLGGMEKIPEDFNQVKLSVSGESGLEGEVPPRRAHPQGNGGHDVPDLSTPRNRACHVTGLCARHARGPYVTPRRRRGVSRACPGERYFVVNLVARFPPGVGRLTVSRLVKCRPRDRTCLGGITASSPAL